MRTFCLARGILQGGVECDHVLSDAAQFSFVKLTSLFATLLHDCQPADPLGLYGRHAVAMRHDYRRRSTADLGGLDNPALDMRIHYAICRSFLSQGGTEDQFGELGFPAFTAQFLQSMTTPPQAQAGFSASAQQQAAAFVAANVGRLNAGQRVVYNRVRHALEHGMPEGVDAFMLHAPGGTGKTFVINLLLAAAVELGKTTQPVATSGIAALLLRGDGRTAHSRLKLPINPGPSSLCSVDTSAASVTLLLPDFRV